MMNDKPQCSSYEKANQLAKEINLLLVDGFTCQVVGFGTENYAVEIIGLRRDYPNYRNIRKMPTKQLSFKHNGQVINVFRTTP